MGLPATCRTLWGHHHEVHLRLRRSRASCSSTRSTATTTSTTAKPFRRPIPVVNSRCRPMVAAIWVPSSSRASCAIRSALQESRRLTSRPLRKTVAIQVRALDNVLDVTYWPLQQQATNPPPSAAWWRGLHWHGNTLAMLCLRYSSAEGRWRKRIATSMRDAAYLASVDLASEEKGAFPKFDAKGLPGGRHFASRLPASIRMPFARMAFATATSCRSRPHRHGQHFCRQRLQWHRVAFSWTYKRKKREADGSHSAYRRRGPCLAHVP